MTNGGLAKQSGTAVARQFGSGRPCAPAGLPGLRQARPWEGIDTGGARRDVVGIAGAYEAGARQGRRRRHTLLQGGTSAEPVHSRDLGPHVVGQHPHGGQAVPANAAADRADHQGAALFHR